MALKLAKVLPEIIVNEYCNNNFIFFKGFSIIACAFQVSAHYFLLYWCTFLPSLKFCCSCSAFIANFVVAFPALFNVYRFTPCMLLFIDLKFIFDLLCKSDSRLVFAAIFL